MEKARERLNAIAVDGSRDLDEWCSLVIGAWRCDAVQRAWARRNEFAYNDNTVYLVENAERILKDGFMPTDEDMILVALRTTGISQSSFDVDKLSFAVLDVGGARGERRKWMHCFDDVQAVVFAAGLPEYRQVLAVDPGASRGAESLALWRELSAARFLAAVPMVLMLTKRDLFEADFDEALRRCLPRLCRRPRQRGGGCPRGGGIQIGGSAAGGGCALC